MKELKKATLKEVFITDKEVYKNYVTEFGKNEFLFLDLTEFVYSPKFNVGVIYDIENNHYATDVNSIYRPILNENMEIDRVLKLIEKDLQLYFKFLTVGDYYNNYINNYELKDGEDLVFIEEEIYYNKCLKPLFEVVFNNEEFYNNLMELFDTIGIDEMRIRKDKDGKFTFCLSSLITDKDYYFLELEEDFKMGTIFLELQKQLKKIVIEQSNIQMISVIEGVGDMIDTMKKDNINEHTIHLTPLKNREDNLICLGFDFINNKKLIKTKKEKQMYQKFCDLKDKYNFKDIIFDREKFKVTFEF